MATKIKTKAKSRIFEAVHETASDLHRLGFIDKHKMREFDALRLASVPADDNKKIRALRDHLQLSQSVLAAVLNTSLSTVRNSISKSPVTLSTSPCRVITLSSARLRVTPDLEME